MLLDSASLYFRAFYGVPSSMRAPDGTPNNAVRGFLDMVATLVTRFSPTDMVACLDTDWRPAWRVKLLPSYKTHRVADGASTAALTGGAPAGEAEPEGLAEQVPIILDILSAAGITHLGAPEHEADDVIASFAAQAAGPVDVVTGDRDLFQLIDDDNRVRVLYTGRGVAKLEIFDAAALRKRYGIEPAQYADFATLRGDPSDGLPGVPGIGEKTAASLLTSYGDLPALIAAAAASDRGLGRAAKALAMSADYLAVAPQVVGTVRTLELGPVTTTVPTQPANAERLAELGSTWGVTNSIARLSKALGFID